MKAFLAKSASSAYTTATTLPDFNATKTNIQCRLGIGENCSSASSTPAASNTPTAPTGGTGLTYEPSIWLNGACALLC